MLCGILATILDLSGGVGCAVPCRVRLLGIVQDNWLLVLWICGRSGWLLLVLVPCTVLSTPCVVGAVVWEHSFVLQCRLVVCSMGVVAWVQ